MKSKLATWIGVLGMIISQSGMVHAEEKLYLSITAGGMFGYIPALLLQDTQKEMLRYEGSSKLRYFHQNPLYRKLSGAVGTSTGSIILSLLATPKPEMGAMDPYPPSKIVEFYETRGNSIFLGAGMGFAFNNILMGVMGVNFVHPSQRFDPGQILKQNLAEVFSGKSFTNPVAQPVVRMLSDVKIPLKILAYEQLSQTSFQGIGQELGQGFGQAPSKATNNGRPYVFDSVEVKADPAKNASLESIVTASCSVESIFGSNSVNFQGQSDPRFFVDPGSKILGEESTCDATAYILQDIIEEVSKKPQGEEVTAKLFIMHTGFGPVCEFENPEPEKIKIVYLQPNIQPYIDGYLPKGTDLNFIAADGSDRALNGLKGVAEELMLTPQYQEFKNAFLRK